METARPPAPDISAAVSSLASSARSTSPTAAPLAAIAWAIALPIPLAAPVTSATSPSSEKFTAAISKAFGAGWPSRIRRPVEVVVAKLRCRALSPARLGLPQLHPPDLAADRLGQLREFQPAHPVVRRKVLTCIGKDRLRRTRVRGMARGERHVRLRHSQPDLIGGRHHR